MHDIEREIIKATGYKAQRKFTDRQDYLKSLFTAVQKLTDDDFDQLTEEAAMWANACVTAHNDDKDSDLPDFDEVDEPSDDEAPDEDVEPDDESPDDDEGDDEEEDDESSDDPEPEDEAAEEEEADDEPDDEEDKPVQTELELEVKAPPKKAKAKAPVKPAKKEPVKAKAKPAAKKPKPADDDEEVVLDKWGCMEGSKNSQALAMFEKGASAAEVKAAIGGTYYNILGKMVKQGHRLAKSGSIIMITHMSDKKSKVSSPKKSK